MKKFAVQRKYVQISDISVQSTPMVNRLYGCLIIFSSEILRSEVHFSPHIYSNFIAHSGRILLYKPHFNRTYAETEQLTK